MRGRVASGEKYFLSQIIISKERQEDVQQIQRRASQGYAEAARGSKGFRDSAVESDPEAESRGVRSVIPGVRSIYCWGDAVPRGGDTGPTQSLCRGCAETSKGSFSSDRISRIFQ